MFGISIHALREEGDVEVKNKWDNDVISIHALREEGDLVAIIRPRLLVAISIHALREEGDFAMLGHME